MEILYRKYEIKKSVLFISYNKFQFWNKFSSFFFLIWGIIYIQQNAPIRVCSSVISVKSIYTILFWKEPHALSGSVLSLLDRIIVLNAFIIKLVLLILEFHDNGIFITQCLKIWPLLLNVFLYFIHAVWCIGSLFLFVIHGIWLYDCIVI